jgi:hypothetical protein
MFGSNQEVYEERRRSLLACHVACRTSTNQQREALKEEVYENACDDSWHFIVLLALVLLGGCGPNANEEVCGTWINDKVSGDVAHPQKFIETSVGYMRLGYKLYSGVSDSGPSEIGTEKIDSKWTDSEGNIWYKTLGTVTAGQYKGTKFQCLYKISKSATVCEFVYRPIGMGEFNPSQFPKNIPSNNGFDVYEIMFRAEK